MIIKNGKLITWGANNRILENYALAISGGVIREIGLEKDILSKYKDDEIIDAKGQYVMPGNICAHTHFYGAFARGMAIPGASPRDFPEILKKLWWSLDYVLDEDAVRVSALVMLADGIKHGTTTIFDHHASPNFIEGSLDVIADAVDLSGLRGVLCYEVTDRNGKQGALNGIDENIRFIQKSREEHLANGRLAGIFGLHASLTLSEETLDNCKKAAPDDVGFHIHVAEHQDDEYDSLAKTGMRVVDRLAKHEMLGNNSIVVHAVHIDAKEALQLATSRTWVTHQPRSNMNNGVGVADVESYLRLGIPVCIGTDGFSHTMWEEWKTAYLLQKIIHKDPRRMNGQDVIQMGVYNNAALASKFFKDNKISEISPGAYADLIFVDYHPYTLLTSENLPWHILFGFHESMVTTTIVDGKVLMRDREILTLDEEQIAEYGRSITPKIWERYEKIVQSGKYLKSLQ